MIVSQVHNDTSLHDGLTPLSTGQAKLYRGNRELLVDLDLV